MAEYPASDGLSTQEGALYAGALTPIAAHAEPALGIPECARIERIVDQRIAPEVSGLRNKACTIHADLLGEDLRQLRCDSLSRLIDTRAGPRRCGMDDPGVARSARFAAVARGPADLVALEGATRTSV